LRFDARVQNRTAVAIGAKPLGAWIVDANLSAASFIFFVEGEHTWSSKHFIPPAELQQHSRWHSLSKPTLFLAGVVT
jgi:hypothetical protein